MVSEKNSVNRPLGKKVLILVVVEDCLGEYEALHPEVRHGVLILVLLEDGLGKRTWQTLERQLKTS